MDKLSARHFMFLILGTAIVSLKTYPETFIRNGGRDSWIAVAIASVFIFMFFLGMLKLWKASGEMGMVELYQRALGKRLGKVVLGLFLFTLFLTLVECGAVEADSMHENMLIETPKWYLLLFFIVPLIYVVKKELVTIVTVTIIGIVLIMLAGINLAILTAPHKRFYMLLPIFEKGLTGGFLLCILQALGLYGSIAISFPYLKKVKEGKKKLIKYSIIGLIILIQMEIVASSGIIMTFEPEMAVTMNYPKLLQTQLVSYLQFLEFGELYVMLQILGGWLIKYMLTFYAILILLREMKIRPKTIIIITFSLSALVFVSAFMATYDMVLLFRLLTIYEYICLINFIIIPFLVFMLARIKTNIGNKVNQ